VFSRIGQILGYEPMYIGGGKKLPNTSFLCLGDEYLITGHNYPKVALKK